MDISGWSWEIGYAEVGLSDRGVEGLDWILIKTIAEIYVNIPLT